MIWVDKILININKYSREEVTVARTRHVEEQQLCAPENAEGGGQDWNESR